MSNVSFVVNGQSEEPPQGGGLSSGLANDQREESSGLNTAPPSTVQPILICLLGGFLLLKRGQPVTLRHGGKTEALLSHLAIQNGHRSFRDTLLHALWPDDDVSMASQSLHSLVHSLHKSIGNCIGGAHLIVHNEGRYQLNVEAGVGVDTARFDALSEAGDRQYRVGDLALAMGTYRYAIALYRGDLSVDVNADTHGLMERERLRARYLTLLARLADFHFGLRDYDACLGYARRLLTRDPCREDAHRLVMRCHVRRGERAEALRHYRLCENVLRFEFDAAPESATTALFDQVRLDPAAI